MDKPCQQHRGHPVTAWPQVGQEIRARVDQARRQAGLRGGGARQTQ